MLPDDIYHPPGTRVRHDGWVNSGQGGPEFGIVVHCWFDNEIRRYDCYVAFFGNELPTGKPAEKPYVLRYSARTLIAVG